MQLLLTVGDEFRGLLPLQGHDEDVVGRVLQGVVALFRLRVLTVVG